MEIPIQFPVTTPHRKSIGNGESGPSVWLLLFFRVFNYTVPDLEGIRYICARVYVCVCVCVETHIRRLVIYDLFINALTRFDKFRWWIHNEDNWINIFYVVQFLEHSRQIFFLESYFLYHRDCQWRRFPFIFNGSWKYLDVYHRTTVICIWWISELPADLETVVFVSKV